MIEACEYRNAFLNYKPDIAIITNIDPDHLDFFKTDEAYYAAFERFMAQSHCVVMLTSEYQRFRALTQLVTLPETLVLVDTDAFEVIGKTYGALVAGKYTYQLPSLLVPGGHIRLDASLAYATSQLLNIEPGVAQNSLQNYPGSWRRMEIVKNTPNNNTLISDYGHHPTEIIATL